MTDTLYFTPEERQQISALYAELKQKIAPTLTDGDEERLRKHLLTAVEEGHLTSSTIHPTSLHPQVG